MGMVGTASLPKDPFCQGPCSILGLFSTFQQLFPTLLPPPALTLPCTMGFTSQIGATGGIFAPTLLARDRQGLGSRSGCSSLTMVMNPDSVCSSSLVLHRDSGWDYRTKAKGNSDPRAQHCKGWLSPTANSVIRTCPEGVGHPCGGHHHHCHIPRPCLSASNATRKQITVKVLVHQENVPEKGGVSTFLVAALRSDLVPVTDTQRQSSLGYHGPWFLGQSIPTAQVLVLQGRPAALGRALCGQPACSLLALWAR